MFNSAFEVSLARELENSYVNNLIIDRTSCLASQFTKESIVPVRIALDRPQFLYYLFLRKSHGQAR